MELSPQPSTFFYCFDKTQDMSDLEQRHLLGGESGSPPPIFLSTLSFSFPSLGHRQILLQPRCGCSMLEVHQLPKPLHSYLHWKGVWELVWAAAPVDSKGGGGSYKGS